MGDFCGDDFIWFLLLILIIFCCCGCRGFSK